ncbi:MAG TPA: phage holin family protein [Nocardioides sp.]|uniref:phage holin family protein n=1 Tax=uncultured Nocardioides sp. TaxID=198441 RepID=UPI000EC1413A|nr:phage holin family protein [uncultured Nocardioides sp.]HCB03899.1 phosphodiesterase [Nocardioides sp.]HRI96915.1 phage holin family protein [Nocardioides sp.]
MTNQEAASARTQVAGQLTRESWQRPWYAQLAAFVASVLVMVPAVWICDWLLPGFHAGVPGGPFLFAAVLGIVAVIVQPILVGAAVRLGWIGVLLLAFLGQALIVVIAAAILPMVKLDDYWSAFVVAIVVGLVSTLLGWFGSAGTSQVLVGRLVSRHHRRPIQVADPEVDGVVFVQMDGVPFPVLQMAVTAGTVPTLSRWIRSGSHRMTEWTPKLPATTPASQMGILHGVIDGIPAFRWYDRERDRVLVANKPADAAVIEGDMSTGRGLLVDDGVSISNLFTGDAPAAVLTMSRRVRGGELAQRAVANFVLNPSGLTRALSRSVSELFRDRFQARRAIRRDVQPRCERTWETALLRSVTNGALRDLNTILVAEHMLRGTRSIYVDYVDYDEVAHHAGVLRPESLEALEAIDGVLHQLELVASAAPRRYRFVILSDHGQSQGAIFADRYGEDLATLVARLANSDVAASDDSVEGWGRTKALVDELAAGDGVSSRAGTTASRAMDRHERNVPEVVSPGEAAQGRTATRSDDRPATGDETFHVFGSGNLGLIYVRGEKERLDRAELHRRYPGLVRGLAEHPGVGFVVVMDEGGPIALGNHGSHRLDDGHVEGEDPLTPFGHYAPEFVRRVAHRPEAPDIYVNSLVEPGTEEVAAFEGLVGCHGGLGGWQDRASAVIPTDVPFPEDRIVGADALHVALCAILRHCGHRQDVAYDGVAPAEPAAGVTGS